MKLRNKLVSVIFALAFSVIRVQAQNNIVSSATQVTRSTTSVSTVVKREVKGSTTVTDAPNPNIEWSKVIYRHIDLENKKNAPLYFTYSDNVENKNLFFIIMHLITNGKLNAYEYLDGREIFTMEFTIDIESILARFHIPFVKKDRAGVYTVDPSDIPSQDVMSYYILERWEYDNRKSRTNTDVLAICPILHQANEIGTEDLKYPMFWIKMDDLAPYIENTAIFIDDNDITPRYSYQDFFTMNLYEGEIYKTRNVRNKSMIELYPGEVQRKQASDSIQDRLDGFDRSLWVPSREEVLEAKNAKEALAKKVIPERKSAIKSSPRRPTRSRGNSEAVRSVRDRK